MNITVTKNQVTVDTDYILNDGEYNVNTCTFSFSDDYTDDLVKKAVFIKGETTIEMSIINNACAIPYEVLNEGTFEIHVYAYEVDGEDLVLRLSPSYATAYVRSGSFVENAEAPEEITPTQFEQYMQAMNDGLVEVQNVDIDAEQTSTGATITITNRDNEEKTVTISNGLNGKDGTNGTNGITPTIGNNGDWYLGDVDTGKPSRGEQGVQGEPGQPGKDGTNGTNGTDGFSPIATVSKSGTTATISITDKTGTTTATVSDGTNGQDGVGVPNGGTQGQILAKASATNYDTEWIDVASGGGIEGVFNIQISNLFNLETNSSKSIESTDRPLFLPVIEYIAENPLSTPIILLTSKKNYSTYDSVSLYIFALYNKTEAGNSNTYYFSATSPNNLNSSNNIVYLTLTLSYNASMEQITSANISKTTYSFVNLNGSQTITGTKIFNTLPQSAITPTNNNDLANKKYVDDIVGDIETLLGGI